MGRPNKPGYNEEKELWRFTYNKVQRYICKGVPPTLKPLFDGVPRKVWDEMERVIREIDNQAAAARDPTLFGLSQEFLSWTSSEIQAGRLEASKYVTRRSHIQHLMDGFPNEKILARLVTGDMADEFFDWFRGYKLPRTGNVPSPYYVHEMGKTLRAMLRWGAKIVKDREPARLIPSDPLAGYSYPPQPGAVRGYVEGEVIRRFLRWAWGRARWADMDRRSDPASRMPSMKPEGDQSANLKRRFDRIYILMLRFERLTGCRPGEACGLRWDEITPAIPPAGEAWHPKMVEVTEERRKTRKQTDRKRKIHLSEPVARLLRALERLPGRNSDFVFPHMRGRGASSRGWKNPLAGEPWPSGSAASKKLTAWRRDAILDGVRGVKDAGPTRLVAYANRHALASEGSSLGFSDEQIAELLGNTPEVMRKVYAHSVDDMAADTNKRLAELRREIGRKRREADGKSG